VAGAFLWSFINPTLLHVSDRQTENAEAIPGNWEELLQFSEDFKMNVRQVQGNVTQTQSNLIGKREERTARDCSTRADKYLHYKNIRILIFSKPQGIILAMSRK
tara:strand:+ start:991 stop:1302 length:312 start_codon:yes stop_codon:yes gene_type:complete